jgi:hypothetical protein
VPDDGATTRISPAYEPDPWERYLTEPFRGRKVIVGFELLAGMTVQVRRLRDWGARPPLLLADGRGTGPVPGDEAAGVVMVEGLPAESLTEQGRARMRPEERLTAEVVDAVNRYDPDRTALWWAGPIALNEPLLGRPVVGGRPRNQAALEDKLVVDDILDAVGAERAPSRVAPAAYEPLMQATLEVVAKIGPGQVVWVGDNRDGINGGGDYVRWVRTLDQAREAAAYFGLHCDRVRVATFLDGVPCSVHAIVLLDGVVVLRPVELVSLRDPTRGVFVYGGLGTTWSPPPADVDTMRDLARRIGEHLQRAHGYQGAFGIDGVLTRDGFRVTELNTRVSGGLTRLDHAAPEAHLELVHMNALLGRDVGRPASEIEDLALTVLAENPFVDTFGLSRRQLPGDGSVDAVVRAGEGRFELAESDDTIIGSVVGGPTALGSFFRFTPLDGIVRPGERVAPLSVLLNEFANRTWDAGLPTGLIPPDVRGPSGGADG